MTEKIAWSGRVLSVQPRILLSRSFDERAHSYLGFSLLVEGTIGVDEGSAWIGIGKAAQSKHGFRVGLRVRGQSAPLVDPTREAVEFYKTSALRVDGEEDLATTSDPPWHGTPPDLPTYRERGHRRLDARTYTTNCTTCIWGCTMAVEMIVDHWNPNVRKYRQETFCYGPKSCEHYRAGPKRKVPGRKGMSYTEEDWVDEEATAHRGPDE